MFSGPRESSPAPENTFAKKIWSAIAAGMADPLENENNSLTTNVTRKIIWYRNVLLRAMLVTGQKRNKTIPVTQILSREQKREPDDIPPSETQGQSVGSGEKAGRKFSSTGERAPGYWLSPRYFKKFKRMPAPVWAQKNELYYSAQSVNTSPEFFSCVRTRQLLSRSRLVWLMHQRNARSRKTFSLI